MAPASGSLLLAARSPGPASHARAFVAAMRQHHAGGVYHPDAASVASSPRLRAPRRHADKRQDGQPSPIVAPCTPEARTRARAGGSKLGARTAGENRPAASPMSAATAGPACGPHRPAAGAPALRRVSEDPWARGRGIRS